MGLAYRHYRRGLGLLLGADTQVRPYIRWGATDLCGPVEDMHVLAASRNRSPPFVDSHLTEKESVKAVGLVIRTLRFHPSFTGAIYAPQAPETPGRFGLTPAAVCTAGCHRHLYMRSASPRSCPVNMLQALELLWCGLPACKINLHAGKMPAPQKDTTLARGAKRNFWCLLIWFLLYGLALTI